MPTPRGIRTIDPLSVGSGARLRELIKLPYWLAVGFLSFRGIFRNPLITLSVLFGFYLWYKWGSFISGNGAGFIGTVTWGFILSVMTILIIWGGTIGAYWVSLGGRWETAWWYYKLRSNWRHAIVSVGLKSREGKHIPRYYRVRPVKNGLRYNVNMVIAGRVISDLQAEIEDMAQILSARSAQMFPLKKVGHARVVMLWKQDVSIPVEPDTPLSEKTERALAGDHTRVVFGRVAGAAADAILSLRSSILIVGLSLSGKSNILRTIFHRLIQQHIPHKLYVVDDAGGVELTELEGYPETIGYVDMADEADKLIKKAYKDMLGRREAMRKLGINRVTISEQFPLCIIMIDELLLLGEQIKKVPDSELSKILAVGSKFGFIVIGLSQLSQVDAIGRIRDLFPQKVCLATDNADMTDAALGKGAEAAGAKCSEIPLSTPGVGYYKTEGIKGFTKFQGFSATGPLLNVTFQTSKRAHNANRKCARYKYYNVVGKPLYIGKAFDPEGRAKKHAATKLWWSQVDHTRTIIDWYVNEEEALKAETAAIVVEKPMYNQMKQVGETYQGEDAA